MKNTEKTENQAQEKSVQKSSKKEDDSLSKKNVDKNNQQTRNKLVVAIIGAAIFGIAIGYAAQQQSAKEYQQALQSNSAPEQSEDALYDSNMKNNPDIRGRNARAENERPYDGRQGGKMGDPLDGERQGQMMNDPVNGQRQYNRGNCLSDDCLMIDDLEYPAGELTPEAKSALDKAIVDEYTAHATYEKVISNFGSVRPFSMIISAEEQHIASLNAIYDKYDITPPTDNMRNQVVVPATLQEACQVGVDAEIANAQLYRNELLPAVSEYEDITLVFTNLMNASEQKHLPAFERCN